MTVEEDAVRTLRAKALELESMTIGGAVTPLDLVEYLRQDLVAVARLLADHLEIHIEIANIPPAAHVDPGYWQGS